MPVPAPAINRVCDRKFELSKREEKLNEPGIDHSCVNNAPHGNLCGMAHPCNPEIQKR
jgi:hypothetical protein